MSARTRAIVAAALAIGAVVALVFAFSGESGTRLHFHRPSRDAVVVGASRAATCRRRRRRAAPATRARPELQWLRRVLPRAGRRPRPRVPERRHALDRRVDAEAARGRRRAGDADPRVHLRDQGRRAVGSPATAASTRSGWSAPAIPSCRHRPTPRSSRRRTRRDGDVTTSLDALADAIVAKGVQKIPGGIVVDDSRYDTERYRPTWKESYRTERRHRPARRAHRERRVQRVGPPQDRGRRSRAERGDAAPAAVEGAWRAGRRGDPRERTERRGRDRDRSSRRP